MELVEEVSIIIKLLYMNTMLKIDELEAKLLKTPLQRKAYASLDGKKTITKIAQIAGYSDERTLKAMLPEWERRGLILSAGKGAGKRYLNIYNLII